jgi:hypothetical protein
MQQMLCSLGSSKSFAITISPVLLQGCPSRDTSPAPESTFCFRQPANSEPIDAGSLDDQLLMALTEDFGVDQPCRRAATHRAFCDSHGVDLKQKGARSLATPLRSVIQFLVYAAGLLD